MDYSTPEQQYTSILASQLLCSKHQYMKENMNCSSNIKRLRFKYDAKT